MELKSSSVDHKLQKNEKNYHVNVNNKPIIFSRDTCLYTYLFSRRRYKHCLDHSKHIRKPYMKKKINQIFKYSFFPVKLHKIVKYTNLGLSLDGFFFLYSSSNFWAFNCCFLISRSSSKAPSKKINNSCDSEQQKVAPK